MEYLSVLPFEIPVMTMITALHCIHPRKERQFNVNGEKKWTVNVNHSGWILSGAQNVNQSHARSQNRISKGRIRSLFESLPSACFLFLARCSRTWIELLSRDDGHRDISKSSRLVHLTVSILAVAFWLS